MCIYYQQNALLQSTKELLKFIQSFVWDLNIIFRKTIKLFWGCKSIRKYNIKLSYVGRKKILANKRFKLFNRRKYCKLKFQKIY